jgi:phospholipid/cholesterol/gamma-HCH transport system permease protein
MIAMVEFVQKFGGRVLEWVRGQGYAARFFLRLAIAALKSFARPRLVINQLHFLGNYSLPVILVAGLFVGAVLGLLGHYTLKSYGSEQVLGVLVAQSLIRELGPVVTSLLFVGRAGTSLTAEIGLMKAGEQLSAMEMMAVDPIDRVLAPRFAAGVIAVPLLSAMFMAIGILGGYWVGVPLIGVDEGAFWSQMQAAVDLRRDVGNGLLKSLVFGIVVSFVALYVGYEADPTPEGVSRATTKTVVIGSLATLGLDFLLTAVMFTSVG